MSEVTSSVVVTLAVVAGAVVVAVFVETSGTDAPEVLARVDVVSAAATVSSVDMSVVRRLVVTGVVVTVSAIFCGGFVDVKVVNEVVVVAVVVVVSFSVMRVSVMLVLAVCA